MALNRDMLGKIFSDGQVFDVSAERIAAYAAATNSDLDVYRDGGSLGEIMAPPMFGVVPSREALALAITDNALKADLARLLHAEQVMEFLCPIRVGDRLLSEAEIIFFDDKRSGEFFDVEARCRRENGEMVYRARFSLFIRAEERKPQADLLPPLGRAGDDPEKISNSQKPDWSVAAEVALDQAQRYAEASGDNNPIHINEDFAKAVGFPGCILHGLCTMAMAQHAIIDQACDADPRRLKSMRGRFSRPVMLGDTLQTQARIFADSNKLAYEVLNQDNKAVIKEGRAVIDT